MSLDAATDPAESMPVDDNVDGAEAAWASERAAIRALVASALERARPQPIARQTLALLIEARLVAQEEAPGYRVVDRDGSPRKHPESDEAATLDDLVEDLRRDHPSLFRPAEPEPAASEEPAAAIVPSQSAVRPWAAPSARMRSLVAASTERGRALAAAAGAGWGQARNRLQAQVTPDRPDAVKTQVAGSAAPSRPRPANGLWRRRLRRTALRLRYGTAILATRSTDRFRRWFDDARDAVGAGGILRRPSMVAALLGVAILGLLTVLSSGDRSSEAPEPASQPATGREAPPEPPQEATPQQPAPRVAESEPQRPAKPERAPAPPPDDEPAPDDAPMQAEAIAPAGGITGKAEVIDTATLKINGKVVRLFGVVWVRGGQSEELARYLGNRPVTCQPVAGSDAHLCSVDGRDLSEVVLFNGGGRASPEATPDLVAAEDRARTERLGVWAR